jgi:hypothetical protein
MSRADSPLRGKVIFNIGARRSGTFWLQRSISAHPQIGAVPSETHLFFGVSELFERLQHAARSSPQVAASFVERDVLLDRTRDLCDAVLGVHLAPGDLYVAERTALHVQRLPLVDEVYPDARLIHIIRDGRDAARSLAAQDFGPDRLGEAAAEWREAILAARAAGLPPERYREVRYEELLEDPELLIRGIYDWLGVAAEDDVMAGVLAEVRTPANVDRVERRGIGAEKWQDAFTAEDLAAFEAVAGDLLRELGYPEGEARGARTRPRRPRIARRVRNALTRSGQTAGEQNPLQRGIAHRQTVADEVVGALRTGAVEAIREHCDPNVRVAVVDAGGRREARGDAGLELLAEAVRADPAMAGEQVVGDTHAAVPTMAYVLSHETPEGRRDQVVFVTMPGRVVRAVTLYLLPLG